MIKANEFRIGNLYSDKELPNSTANILIVQQINHKFEVVRDHFLINDCYTEDKCFPVPLTPEYLERFGFSLSVRDKRVYTDNNTYNGYHTGYYFATHSGLFYFVESSIYSPKAIKYVHQFQNMYFALTGEELKIQKP